MKRKIILSLITICVLSFASCGKQETTATTESTMESTEATSELESALQQDASMETFNYKLGNYDSGMDTTTESTGTVEASTDNTSTESKAEINENDSQTSEGEANEDNVEQTTSNSDSLDDIASAKSYTLSEQEKADLKALGATEEQINNVKSGQDFIDLVYKLVNGDSNSAGGSSTNDSNTVPESDMLPPAQGIPEEDTLPGWM